MIVLMLAALLQSTTPPPVRTIVKGQTSAIDAPRQVAVRSAADWDALWKAHGAGGPAPAVDFSREMVVGVFLGRRPTAAYNVEIVKAVGNRGAMVVQYVETAPSRQTVTAQILTAPYHLAAMPKHDGEVRFQKVEK